MVKSTLQRISAWAEKTRRIPAWVALFGAFLAVFNYGYDVPAVWTIPLKIVFILVLSTGISSILLGYFSSVIRPRKAVWFFDGLYIGILAYTCVDLAGLGFHFHETTMFIAPVVFLMLLREVSTIPVTFNRDILNPAQLFIGSFAAIVVLGTFLLMLPNATVVDITLVDAVFTATSAVCITGLIVVETGEVFSVFGQSVIIILVQIGAIGVMTFAGFFSYFFRGRPSYEDQIVLGALTNNSRMDEVFKTLRRIIFITLLLEAIGAVFIFYTVDANLFSGLLERIYFAVFHAISGFCNAGFTTMSGGLYNEVFQFSYGFHMIIAVLFIIGGIGFPIVFNSIQYVKYLFVNILISYGKTGHASYRSHIINLNTRIVLITSLILLVGGTIVFFIFEKDNTLAAHPTLAGKWITAFFGAATPRSSGFNTIDTSALNFHTIMIVFFLMWVGGSPASTGGGIKTSTLAISTLNFFAVARGKERIELYRREVPSLSVKRAGAIISLSLIAIGTSTFLVTFFDSDKDLLHIGFECFSAYSTCGLSLGITGDLTDESKIVIVISMFIGRITLLTFLAAFLRKEKYNHYRYPKEDILIN